MQERFTGSFTQQEPIPDDGIAAALEVLRHGRLHRYNLKPGETGEAALLEQEFAAAVGAKYCLAVTSGGYAMATALRAVGVKPGDRVLSNAFTLAPVPGAIAGVGAVPVFVEATETLTIDLDDLAAKASAARVLLLSHMRGHICDMDRLMAICTSAGITVIEDCAHTMGASWNSKKSGSFGKVACFSTQTYKHLNSGEGGLLTTDDDKIMARAIIYSGSYMFFERNGTLPPADVFTDIKLDTPNYSGRMDNVRASILRAQLPQLDANCARWNARYRALETRLRQNSQIQLPERPAAEGFVGSSLLFRVKAFGPPQVEAFIAGCAARGVELKWFGGNEPHGFTSRFDSWRYIKDKQHLPQTLDILATTFDLRIPLTFSVEDMETIGEIIDDEACSVAPA